MNPNQTAPIEQSDLGPYCLQHSYQSTPADERADDKDRECW